jgi:5-methyltetrahydrofolate--homocysteine methyltransferase
MLIVGEPINASRKAIKTAIDNQYSDGIKTAAIDQIKAGAHCINIKTGVFVSQEPKYLNMFEY